jgi:hypothetical protein
VLFVFLTCLLGLLAGCPEKQVDIHPKRGPYIGGDPVTISGGNFGITQGMKIYFGKNAAKPPVIKENGEVVVEPPAGDVNQTVDVVIVIDDSRELRIPKAYTYIDPTAVDQQKQ